MKFLLALLATATCAMAQLTFEKTEIEIIAKPDQESITVDFAFSNKTDQAIQIQDCKPQCSCLAAETTTMLVPVGGSGTIRATLDAKNLVGTVSKSVEIHYQGIEQAQLITIKAVLPEIIKPDTRTLQWTFEEARKAKTIRLTIDQAYPTKILTATPVNNTFTAELRTIEEKKSYEITVTPPLEQNTAAVLSIIKIQTDSPYQRHQNLECFVLIRPKDR